VCVRVYVYVAWCQYLRCVLILGTFSAVEVPWAREGIPFATDIETPLDLSLPLAVS
jgi:hypothetical protein